MSTGPVVEASGGGKATGTIIFLHGLGDTGHGWAPTIGQIKPSYVKCICPTAAVQPVSLNSGYPMPSWFDLFTLDKGGPEDADGIKKAGEMIHKIIENEEKNGIPSNRIVLGGFSQGGGLAIHAGLRYPKPLAGILAFSCWVPLNADYPDACPAGNRSVPIFQCHGNADPIVQFKFGESSKDKLKTFMTNYEFKMYEGMAHCSCDQELRDAAVFFKKCLPAVP